MSHSPTTIAIVGAGPAGLMAAEAATRAGFAVEIFDAMPSPARKLLLAGKGGLNLTHSESLEAFVGRYGGRAEIFGRLLAEFGPEQVRDWAAGLGVATFVGTSGRVFPVDFKAAPLLRAWLRRLKGNGMRLHSRHRWRGWGAEGRLRFETPTGPVEIEAAATVLALGGASWPSLGSDGGWVEALAGKGVEVRPLLPANCGFDVDWSDIFRERFAGAPLKPVRLSFAGVRVAGEAVVTATGIEGGPVYALSASLRDAIRRDGAATLELDLKPDWSEERLCQALSRPRGSRSLASHLKRSAGIEGVAAGLLREVAGRAALDDPARLAILAKALPLRLTAARPLAEAISTAGGIAFEELNEALMIRRLPGVFAAGEMLDWEAPTGGYLLTGCLATGCAAGLGAARWVGVREGRGLAFGQPVANLG